MSQIALQIIIVLAAVGASGLIGFWLSRRHFAAELDYQSRVMTREIGRLKRQSTEARQNARRMGQELERFRRKARHNR